jgi:hypothetical protein
MFGNQINSQKCSYKEVFMGRIIEHAGSELIWTPINNRMGYELRDNELTIGSILVEGKFLSNAIGKCVDGSWKFKREGLLKSNISVKESDQEIELALFKKNALNRNGTILINGKKIFTINTNFTMTEYSIKNEKGLLISITNITRFPNLTSTVKINPVAINIPELPWMILFSWYLVIMQQFDAAFNSAAI